MELVITSPSASFEMRLIIILSHKFTSMGSKAISKRNLGVTVTGDCASELVLMDFRRSGRGEGFCNDSIADSLRDDVISVAQMQVNLNFSTKAS